MHFLTHEGPNATYAVCHGKARVLHMKQSDGRQRFTDFEVKEWFFQNKMYTIWKYELLAIYYRNKKYTSLHKSHLFTYIKLMWLDRRRVGLCRSQRLIGDQAK